MDLLPLNIASIRRRWNMSQSELAALLKVSRHQISNWERGRTMMPTDSLLKLQLIAGIPANDLCKEELTQARIPAGPLEQSPRPVQIDPVLDEVKQIKVLLERILDAIQQKVL